MINKSSKDIAQLASFLGYKYFTSNGYLRITNEQHQTTYFADMFKIKLNSLDELSDFKKKHILHQFWSYLAKTPLQSSIISLPVNNNSENQKDYWNGIHEKLYQKQQNSQAFTKQDQVMLQDVDHILKNLKRTDLVAMNHQYWLVVFAKSQSELTKFNNQRLFQPIATVASLREKFLCLLHLRFSSRLAKKIEENPRPLENWQINANIAKDWSKPHIHQKYFKINGQSSQYVAILELKRFIICNKHIPDFWTDSLINNANTIGIISFDNNQGLSPFKAIAGRKLSPKKFHLLKRVNIKLLIYGRTPKVIANHIKTIQQSSTPFKLKQVKGYSKQKKAIRSLLKPISQQKDECKNIISSEDLIKAYPCDFQHLTDKHGELFGLTSTFGEFCLDPYQALGRVPEPASFKWINQGVDVKKQHQAKQKYMKDNHISNQTSSFSLIDGDKNTEKAVLAQKLALDAFDRGYLVRLFDTGHQYAQMTKNSGGQIIDLSTKTEKPIQISKLTNVHMIDFILPKSKASVKEALHLALQLTAEDKQTDQKDYFNFDNALGLFFDNKLQNKDISHLIQLCKLWKKLKYGVTFIYTPAEQNQNMKSKPNSNTDKIFTYLQYLHLLHCPISEIAKLRSLIKNNGIDPRLYALDMLPKLHNYQVLTLILNNKYHQSYRWQITLPSYQIKRLYKAIKIK